MMLLLKPCQNTGIPMLSSQRLLLQSAESKAEILLGTDFARVSSLSCLQMQKDWESKLSLGLSHMHLALCVCAHVYLLWLIHL